jgi:hypothetical protein
LSGESTAAFGAGDVYNSGGTLVSNATSAVKLAGKYTQLTGSTVLELDVGGAAAGSQGTLTVAGTATIAGGTLRIKFASGYAPKAGTVLTVLTAGSLKGRFTTVSVDGFSNVTATYGATTLTLTLG